MLARLPVGSTFGEYDLLFAGGPDSWPSEEAMPEIKVGVESTPPTTSREADIQVMLPSISSFIANWRTKAMFPKFYHPRSNRAASYSPC